MEILIEFVLQIACLALFTLSLPVVDGAAGSMLSLEEVFQAARQVMR